MNHPTCSYKDRVVSVAATRAVELGFTSSPAHRPATSPNSVAAHAARLGLSCCVFIPDDLEAGKVAGAGDLSVRTIIAVRGNYDDVNRLCTQVADRYGWGFANINLRAYYAEGAKTYGFEIAEQLGWRFPRHVVSPVAGGTLLPRILKGFEELRPVGPGRRRAAGDLRGAGGRLRAGRARVRSRCSKFPDPVKPQTIAKSIAIGNPGRWLPGAARDAADRRRARDGEDDEIIAGIQLLAETEGIFTEPAGGVTVAATSKLIERGTLPRDESIVICITGNGYKTIEVAERPWLSPSTSAARWPTSRPALAGRDAGGTAA